jgi:hypothetical protein
MITRLLSKVFQPNKLERSRPLQSEQRLFQQNLKHFNTKGRNNIKDVMEYLGVDRVDFKRGDTYAKKG